MRAMLRQPWTWPPTKQMPMMPMAWRSSPRSGSFVRCGSRASTAYARTHVGGGAEPAGADHDRAQCWQNPRRSGWPEASSDEVGQVWNGGLVWDGEPSAQVVPERHAELLAGFHQAQEHIPAIPAHVAAGSAADLAPGHLGPDVVL